MAQQKKEYEEKFVELEPVKEIGYKWGLNERII